MVHKSNNLKSAVDNPQATIAWGGWKLAVPEGWRPLKIVDDRRRGNMIIGDATGPVVQLKWWQPGSPAQFKAAPWIAQRIKAMGSVAVGNAPTPVGINAAGWTAPLESKRGTSRQIWYGYSRSKNLMLECLMAETGSEGRERPAMQDVLKSLTVSDRNESTLWAVHSVTFMTPPDYRLTRRHLYSGDTAMEFRTRRNDVLRLRQVYPGRLAGSRRSMDEWLDAWPFTERRCHTGDTPRDWKDEGRGLHGIQRSGVKRLPSPMGWCKPRHAAAVAAMDEALDRLLIAEHQATSVVNGETVREAILSMNRHIQVRPIAPETPDVAEAVDAQISGPEEMNRDTSMAAYPLQIPPIRSERRDGKLYLTVNFQRPRWQRVLGGEASCQRTFGLDTYGQQVYTECNGRTTVAKIVRRFAREHRLDVTEAELSVTSFLKTMMGRGLIAMAASPVNHTGQ